MGSENLGARFELLSAVLDTLKVKLSFLFGLTLKQLVRRECPATKKYTKTAIF